MIIPKGTTVPKKWRVVALIIQIVGCISLALALYMLLGMQYRANILVSELSNEFTRNHIVQGCPLPTLMSYLQKHHVKSVKDPDGGPYRVCFMGVKDVRVLNDQTLVMFKISADQKVENYSFVPDRTNRRTPPQTGL